MGQTQSFFLLRNIPKLSVEKEKLAYFIQEDIIPQTPCILPRTVGKYKKKREGGREEGREGGGGRRGEGGREERKEGGSLIRTPASPPTVYHPSRLCGQPVSSNTNWLIPYPVFPVIYSHRCSSLSTTTPTLLPILT